MGLYRHMKPDDRESMMRTYLLATKRLEERAKEQKQPSDETLEAQAVGKEIRGLMRIAYEERAKQAKLVDDVRETLTCVICKDVCGDVCVLTRWFIGFGRVNPENISVDDLVNVIRCAKKCPTCSAQFNVAPAGGVHLKNIAASLDIFVPAERAGLRDVERWRGIFPPMPLGDHALQILRMAKELERLEISKRGEQEAVADLEKREVAAAQRVVTLETVLAELVVREQEAEEQTRGPFRQRARGQTANGQKWTALMGLFLIFGLAPVAMALSIRSMR
ncbi:hypothetical protein IAT38_007142 [Cryptococcus sp. DSM 104549]